MMVADHRFQQFNALRATLSLALYPLQLIVNLPVATGSWLDETITSREKLREENAILKHQQLLLKAQLQRFAALESENMRLRHLLDSTINIGTRLMIAEIMAVDLDPFRRQISINKGSLQDIYVGQPVLDATGVLGQVAEVTPLSASILLITDPNHALPVQINRNGLRTIASGTGAKERMELLYVPNNADVVEGDLLITSGLGERFPPGYPVGTVSHFEPVPSEPYAQVEITPSAMMESGREVLLLWPGTTPLETPQTPEESER